jgi:hypothetical protein
MKETRMTQITDTGFARLEAEKRLFNPVLKSPTHKSGRFGFRGDLALKFAAKVADESRPPELAAEQVMAIASGDSATIPFIAAYLHSFAYLETLTEVLGETLSPSGKYFIFCNNIDLLKKYEVSLGGATFYILAIDEATVYNELLELLDLEKNDLKKLDIGGKLDVIADAATKFKNKGKFVKTSFEDVLAVMEPVRDRGANRPV